MRKRTQCNTVYTQQKNVIEMLMNRVVNLKNPNEACNNPAKSVAVKAS